ncbi:MAG: AraC family transcriptional regulator [Verrucomicrobiales bacterium]|nr:AraC family transcriptional regulator [Verrucomicrobiales bacterium]
MFDHLDGVAFFAKNKECEIMAADQSFLRRFGFKSELEILGKNDFELFPESLAESFRADDCEVMASGEAKLGIVELFLNRQGIPDWFVTNKLPLYDRDGEVMGVTGTVQVYEMQRRMGVRYGEIGRVVDYIRTHLGEALVIRDLAASVGLSVRQFDRRFKEVFGIPPKSFIIKTRIQAACLVLQKGQKSLSDVAGDLGFYDQSSFTYHFRQQMGITPLKYKRDYRG